VAAHETDLWLELARQDSGWTGTDFKRSKSGADMVAARASRSLDAFAIERRGHYWILVAILARIVRVRRVTGFWNRPLACVFGPNVSWKLPDVGHHASAECSSAELAGSTSTSVGRPLPGTSVPRPSDERWVECTGGLSGKQQICRSFF
jgi:hypothetical protein